MKLYKYLTRFSLVAATILVAGNIQAKDVYRLHGDAPVGSKFRPVEAESPIPFNKRFDQLTEKQMRIYRADFPGMGTNDTPPFPKKGMRAIYKPIIKGHERLARGGVLTLIAKINEQGGVDEVAIYESPMKELSDLATTVMFNTEFVPPTCDGKPCKMEFPFQFELRNRSKSVKTLSQDDFG